MRDAEKRLATLVASLSSENNWEDVDAFVTDVGTAEVEEAARRWLASGDDAARRVGFDILDHLALYDKTIWPLVVAEVEHAAEDPNRDVREWAAHSLRYVHIPEALPLLLLFANDSDADVRRHTMSNLSDLYDETNGDSRIVRALLVGLEDADENVRDWAAFALGTLLAIDDENVVDTPEIRDALARHLDDDGGDTCAEAAVGLARRGDERVLPVLREWLARDDAGTLWIEAAREIADPQLLPLLERLRDTGWSDNEREAQLLGDAIARCRSD